MTRRTTGLLVLAAALLCGCASTQTDDAPSLISDTQPSTGAAAAGGYQLSPTELAYDCKKLTGTMQIRILQMRGRDPNASGGGVAQAMQSITTPIFGGTTETLDPKVRYQSNYAMLQAYNARLAEKRCNTFDIDAELKKTDPYDTPRPIGTER